MKSVLLLNTEMCCKTFPLISFLYTFVSSFHIHVMYVFVHVCVCVRVCVCITIKSHCLAHWALDCRFWSPRKGWCYSGESYMNRTKTLGASCVKGNSAWDAAIKMVSKYRHAMHFLMAQAFRDRGVLCSRVSWKRKNCVTRCACPLEHLR